MAWFRFDDTAIDHPKFLALSDGAFRLWFEGGTYCTKHLTDGLILRAALNGFRYVTRKRVDELVAVRLWDVVGEGFQMHDYHDWNDPSDVIKSKREQSRERTRRWRHAYRDASQHAHVPNGVDKSTTVSTIQRAERESEGKPLPASSGRQAGRLFLHRWQLDALIDTLGTHADGFGLDDWLEAINRRLEGHALPRDPWKWVQAELHTEIERRGIATADASQPQPTNKRIAGLMAGGEAFLRRAAEQKGRIA
jgi:hypothetical protein